MSSSVGDRALRALIAFVAAAAVIVIVLQLVPQVGGAWTASWAIEPNASFVAVIASYLPNTLLLILPATLISAPLANLLGTRAGLRSHAPLFDGLTLLGSSLPAFWLGLLLAGAMAALRSRGVFSLPFGDAEPATLTDQLLRVVLPVLALSVIAIATGSRYVRSAVRAAQDREYVQMARARGLPQQVIAKRYVRSAANPLLSALIWSLPALIGGTIVVENVFGYRGAGWLFVQALRSNDWPIVAGLLLLLALLIAIATVLDGVLTNRGRARRAYMESIRSL